MTYEEFIKTFYEEILPNKSIHLRDGQALMNYLGKVWIEEYRRMSSLHFYDRTDIDCFYVDKLIPNTLEHLKTEWCNFPK
jgi:hypothetical protein